MKKELKYEQALQMLKRGEAINCQLSNREDDCEVVREVSRLVYLYNLSKQETQLCKMYRISQSKSKIEENQIEISFDEAYTMIYSGNSIYYKEEGKEEEITDVQELLDLRKTYEIQGKKLLLYWHE